MFKILTLALLLLSGCATHYETNAPICKKIKSDPNSFVPEECRNYSEKEAEKAFNKTKKKHESREDIIKFSKDADDKQN